MQKAMNICFSADRKYGPYLGVTITSIIENRGDDELFNFYILDGGILAEDKEKIANIKGIERDNIEYLGVDIDIFKTFPIGSGPHISTFYRLLLPDLLPNIEKALYLDCDIIVNGSLAELFNTDISDFYLAGVTDETEQEQASRLGVKEYINAGVLLLNLKRWREDSVFESMKSVIAKDPSRIVLADQDLINLVLQGKVLKVGRKWNCQINEECADILDSVIIHYICTKPWYVGYSLCHRDLYLDFLRASYWSEIYYNLVEKERDRSKYLYLFRTIPIISIINIIGKWQIKLFGFLPLCTIKTTQYKKRYFLLGIIPIYKIKHKQGYIKHYLFGFALFIKYKD